MSSPTTGSDGAIRISSLNITITQDTNIKHKPGQLRAKEVSSKRFKLLASLSFVAGAITFAAFFPANVVISLGVLMLSAAFFASSKAKDKDYVKSYSRYLDNQIGQVKQQIKRVGRVNHNSVGFIPTTSSTGELSLIKQAPSFKELVLQGGGVKGITYPDFLMGLDIEKGLLRNLTDIRGTSAGALMSFLLASGVKLSEIKKTLSEVNIYEQLRRSDSVDLEMEGTGFAATRIIEKLEDKSRESITLYLEGKNGSDFTGAQTATFNRLKAKFTPGNRKNITFNDLKDLHSLNPKQFKKLHVTAVDKQTRELITFDAKNRGDVSCSLAVRASMAIPKLIKPVIFDDGGTQRQLIDGGVECNVPVALDADKSSTLVLHFDKSGAGNQILFDPASSGPDGRRRYGPAVSRFRKIFLGDRYVENHRRDAKNIHKFGVNAVVVPHRHLNTTSFFVSEDIIKLAQKEARLAGINYALQRKEYSGIAKSYATPQELVSDLSAGQKSYLLGRESINQRSSVQKNKELTQKSQQLADLKVSGGSTKTILRSITQLERDLDALNAERIVILLLKRQAAGS